MFWTDILVQLGLFGEDKTAISSSISQLVRFAEDSFPDADCNFHRMVAFLTHNETQDFLAPMLVAKFGSLDNAKVPTIEWLESVGSFETLARLTRNGAGLQRPSGLGGLKRGTPSWYVQYMASQRFDDMKNRAAEFWRDFLGGQIHCSVNARHLHECWHHSDYGRLGEGDEFRFLIPLCRDCHCGVTSRGPNVPLSVPEGVKQWI